MKTAATSALPSWIEDSIEIVYIDMDRVPEARAVETRLT